jgi:peptidoglycan/LPS O-acetylase OafA/YrhL
VSRPIGIPAASLKAQNNNLTMVRLVLASAVIMTHCYWKQHGGLSGEDWFAPWLGKPISQLAVDGFFFLSGFLVFGSLHRHAKIRWFLMARLARMWPALAMSILATVMVGLAVTTADPLTYFGHDTQRFVLGNLSFAKPYYTLTGVYCDNAPCILNGSLWTLPWEMRCYLALILLGLLGLTNRKAMGYLVLPGTIGLAALVNIPPLHAFADQYLSHGAAYFLETTGRLWTLFALGCFASIWHQRIWLNGWLLLALFAANLLVGHTDWGYLTRLLLTCYAVLWCGFRSSRFTPLIARMPDYSYGIYIYAFPIMVGLAALLPNLSAAGLAALNLLAVLPVAALSWHLLEKPALDAFRRRSPATRHSAEAPAASVSGTAAPAATPNM